MARRTQPARRRGTRRRAKAPRTPSPPTKAKRLLILECDSSRLASQGVTLASDFKAIMDAFPVAETRLVRATTKSELLREFGALASGTTFDAVLVIGHSSPGRLILTADESVTWSAFGEWMKPFKPKRLFLAACWAGTRPVARALFRTIRSLREVYGSPSKTSSRELLLFKFLLPALLLGVEIPADVLRVGQLLNLLLGRGVVFRQGRVDVGRRDMQADRAWGQIERAANAVRDRIAST